MESLKRLVGVLFAPTDTFRAIAERPTWAIGLAVLLALGAVLGFVAVDKLDVDAQRDLVREQIEDRQGLRGEELERQVDTVMGINERVMPFTPLIGTAFGVLAYLVMALLFMVGARLADGEIDFRRSLATTVHGMVPQGVSGLIALPVVMSQETVDPESLQSGSFLTSNLGFLAPEDGSQVVEVLLASIDLFTIWSVVVLVIGFSVVARLSRGAATALVVGAWVLWIAVKIGLAAVFG